MIMCQRLWARRGKGPCDGVMEYLMQGAEASAGGWLDIGNFV